MQRLLNGQSIEMTEQEIAELEASRIAPFNEQVFHQNLSLAFDAKFETYWREKGYEGMEDLLSHASNPYSKYRLEALNLINWWHTEWDGMIQNITEHSSIEELLNNLDPYNG